MGTKKYQPLKLNTVFESTVFNIGFKVKRKEGRSFTFDSDSYVIRIDNHASRYISNSINHFINSLSPTANTILRNTGGTLQFNGIDTLCW